MKSDSFIYLDHAATSHPKAPGVVRAVTDFITSIGANPGRSGHRLSTAAARVVYACRKAIAELFDAPSSERVIFTHNITYALNMVLLGRLREGDHVLTTRSEHNALMRPLRFLEKERNIEITYIETAPDGQIDAADIRRAIGPKTRLLALLHGSNVTGIVRNLDAIVEAKGEVPLLLDTAQTAGSVAISLKRTPVEFLAFTGHKGLLGPTGTGGVIIAPGFEIKPWIRGGTGSNSESEIQPSSLPDALESGTCNAAGLAGLRAAVDWLLEQGIREIRERERRAARLIYDRLGAIKGIRVLGGFDENHLPTFSTDVPGHSPSEVGLLLDRREGICVRVGLHCAPGAHRCLGSLPAGTIRVSAGPLMPPETIERALDGIERVVSAL